MLGWVAAAVGVSSGLPQMVRIVRTQTVSGISVLLWQFSAAGTGAWAVHGFLVQAPQLQIPNIAVCMLASVIIYLVAKHRHSKYRYAFGLPLLLGVSLSCINIWLGPLAFGIAVIVPQLAGQFAQLRSLLVSTDVAGVSGLFLAIFVFVQILWWTFGLLTRDWALIVSAGVMTLATGTNLVIFLTRRNS